MSELRNSYSFLCRNCYASGYLGADKPPVTCPKCEQARLVVDDDIFNLHIAHLDCDSFYASIEKRDNPDLQGKPVMVGGETRGVVAAACYEARKYGVRSAMPTFKARQLCPDIIAIKPRMDHYVAVSRQIRQMMLSLTPLVEPLSIDEAFLDLSGTQALHKACAAEMLMRLQKEIQTEIGITVSVGLAANKSLAKLASDQDKPNGFFVLNAATAAPWLAPRPVFTIFGIGKAAARKLTDAGYQTCDDLVRADLKALVPLLGKNALFIQNLAKGIDSRKINPIRDAKSVSSETTFHTDLHHKDDLIPLLEQQSLRVSRRLKEKALKGNVVTIKLKSSQFKTITRSRTLARTTDQAHEIFATASVMLENELAPDRKWRLLGVGVYGFSDGNQNSDFFEMIDDKSAKKAKIEKALDDMHAKFGSDLVFSGRQAKYLKKPQSSNE
ncbi:MAG: DNA polymerase IV [Candidatus Puniceispirillaceae bacterium]